MKKITWGKKQTIAQLSGLLNIVRSNTELLLVGEALEKKPYSSKALKQAVEFWISDTSTKEITRNKIKDTWNKVNDILENRINCAGLHNKLNSTITQFTLKNLYGWKDKIDLETKNYNIELANILNQIPNDNLINGFTIDIIKDPEVIKAPVTLKGLTGIKSKKALKQVKHIAEQIDIFR